MRLRHKLLVLLAILLIGCGKAQYTCPDGTTTKDISECGEDCRLEKVQADNENCDFRDYRYTIDHTPMMYDNATKSYVIDKVTVHNKEYTDGGFRILTSFYQDGKEIDYGFAPVYVLIGPDSDYIMEAIVWPTEEQKGKDIKVKVVDVQQTRACSAKARYENKVVCG